VKAIKSDKAMSKKGRHVFQEKNRGVTPSVAAPGVTHPSDATDGQLYITLSYSYPCLHGSTSIKPMIHIRYIKKCTDVKCLTLFYSCHVCTFLFNFPIAFLNKKLYVLKKALKY